MPRPALLYGWTVVTVGTAAAMGAAFSWQSADLPVFLLCLALAVLASTFKVKLPGLTSTVSPAFVFVLVAAGQLGGPETIAVGAASAFVQSVWRSTSRPGALQLWFNVATVTIAAGLAYGVAHGLVTTRDGAERTVLLAVAGLVLFVTNTLLVSTILSLIKETPLQLAWRSLQTWAVPYYLAGGVLAGVWAQLQLTAGVWVAVMALLSVYVLSTCYRGLVELGRERLPV